MFVEGILCKGLLISGADGKDLNESSCTYSRK